MSHSTPNGARQKPSKPRPDFPLFAHATGRWAKKIRGKLVYFGPWDDPQGALERYLDEKDDLYAGRVPRRGGDGLTVRDLVNRFLTFKQNAVDTGELSVNTFGDYHRTCARIVEAVGRPRAVEDLRPEDFEGFRAALAKRMAPNTLATEIGRVKAVFRYAEENELVKRSIRYGSSFKAPSQRVLLRARHERGQKMIEPHEARTLIDNAPLPFKAYILLGLNCGFGAHDVATVPRAAIDLDRGWIVYPRPKTAVPRRCPLWPETSDAVERAMESRPDPVDPEHDCLAFLGGRGRPCYRSDRNNTIGQWFRKYLIRLGMHKPGWGFYVLRHVFRTVADETRDQVAVDAIMGHATPGMDTVYRERISGDRLRALVDHVHGWVFGAPTTEDDRETDAPRLRLYAG